MRTVALVLLLLLMPLFGMGQQQWDTKDLKVGVVLSGGGAKGLAHIGALKIIEDAGIRIDYIGGTSMGAIVGGLYASGYTASQLDSIFSSIDFEVLIQDNVPRGSKTFYEKEDAERYALTLPFDGFKVSFPQALSKGQNVYNLLSELTQHVGGEVDFSNLNIPFFCVATDIEQGTQVLLEEGYLPRALTASGALPSLFNPVELDGKLLIDGGVVNNYPIDEMRAKGVDIIIGVDVQDDLRSREELNSALEILVQLNNFRTIKDMREKAGKTDLYIKPDISGYSVVSFDQGREIITAGIQAATNQLEALQEIANSQQAASPEFTLPTRANQLQISQVNISGNSAYTRSYILGKLKIRTPFVGSYSVFGEGVKNLMATGNFTAIDYGFEQAPDGSTIVNFKVRENPNKTLLRLGVHYDDLYKSAALVNITRKRVLTNNDVASLDLIAGDNLRYNFNYYVDKGYYWSIGVNSSWFSFQTDVDKDVFLSNLIDTGTLNEIDLHYSELTNQIYVETLFWNAFSFGIGGEHKKFRQFSTTLGITPDTGRTFFEDTDYLSTFGFLKFDTRDDVYFPKSGLFFDGSFNVYLSASSFNDRFKEFSIAKARMGGAKSFGNWSFIVGTEGGFKIGDDSTRSFDFLLGGYGFKNTGNLIPFYGFETLALRGDTYLKADLKIDYELFAKNHLFAVANIANVGDNLFTTQNWIDGVDYSGFGLGYGLQTFAGPLQLIYTYSPEANEDVWYVSLGFWF